jgi:hypothetical protein
MGHSVTFNASLDRNSVILGEQVNVTLQFEDGQPQESFNMPHIPGLQVSPNLSRSINSVLENGKQTTTYSYSFVVEPTRVGDFVIPPFHVKVNGIDMASQPLTLKVAASDPTAPPAAYAARSAFLWVVLPKTNLYLKEPITAELRLYLRSDIHRYGNLQLSTDGTGLTFGRFFQGQSYQRRVGSAVFTVVPFSGAMTPVKVGDVSLNALNGSIVLNTPDPMESFFGQQASPEQVALTSDKINFQVSPLPAENVPPGFNGAVGHYTMNVTAGPTNLVAGDPITLRVQISGHGALDLLNPPEQSGWDNFKVYPPTSKLELSGQLGVDGSKTFEEIVTPQNSDVKALPPVSFTFFDPDQKSYRTLTQPPIALNVRAATPGAMPSAARSGPDNTPPAPDILPIKQHLGTLAQISPPLLQQPWFITFQSVPALALMGCVIWRKRKEALANNPRLRRQRQVAQLVHHGLADLKTLAMRNNSNDFFATLFRLLQEQLGERLDLPASSITEAVIEERMRPAGVPETTLEGLHELFQTCNLARYAPIESSQELAAIIPKVETALNEVRSIHV